MKYKIIITGSTGMVVRGVLLECLDHEKIEKILIINRRSLKMEHPKLSEILLEDFHKIEVIESKLKGYDACFFCLGVSSIGISKSEYEKTTYDLTIHFSEVFLKRNSRSIFTYFSGAGTDSTEKGKVHWTKIKGKTENKISEMPFKVSYMFRPGYIHLYRGVAPKVLWMNILYLFFGMIYQVLKYFLGTATNSINVGRAMIPCLNGEYENNILNNKEINLLAD